MFQRVAARNNTIEEDIDASTMLGIFPEDEITDQLRKQPEARIPLTERQAEANEDEERRAEEQRVRGSIARDREGAGALWRGRVSTRTIVGWACALRRMMLRANLL